MEGDLAKGYPLMIPEDERYTEHPVPTGSAFIVGPERLQQLRARRLLPTLLLFASIAFHVTSMLLPVDGFVFSQTKMVGMHLCLLGLCFAGMTPILLVSALLSGDASSLLQGLFLGSWFANPCFWIGCYQLCRSRSDGPPLGKTIFSATAALLLAVTAGAIDTVNGRGELHLMPGYLAWLLSMLLLLLSALALWRRTDQPRETNEED